MESQARALPQARVEQLLRRPLPDGLMVYDTERHRAHYLNRTAARVWEQCDGQTPVAELARRLEAELELPPAEEVVWLALDRLAKAHLLEGGAVPRPAGLSRRAMIRKWGLAGGIAALLPLVASLAAPSPAEAVSTIISDRNVKEGFAAVDPREILARLAALPITSWSYQAEGEGIRHIGPMAQEFAAAFGLGADERQIALVDANGVAMAAIQGLHQQLAERDAQIAAIRAELAALKERIGTA